MPTEAIQSAITAETVAAAAIEFDAQDRAVIVLGDLRTRIDFWPTALMGSELAPREWEEVAAWLLALVDREPIKSGPAFTAHRILLGSFAHDLRGYARDAGEPIGLEADLRGASTKAEERRIRERIDDRHRAHERYLDDVALQQAAQHVTPAPDPTTSDPATEEAPIDQPAPTKPDDDAWLL